ncbi:MAG: DNA polymerase ligase N-terminal domain-containing protein [Thermodesulfovibrio sp.]|uniref:DNA polymerase ligase N-terminal domain-containing protein n=1 Tax=Thermodesulfovibrio sp. 1176 TaxID=3043424 RepID=UPI0024825D16|nr:DNA polymerase ligase N-terminal domain-containing protein [Thermodesulfovibrio sp. 1176]MDI1472803.1 DNA polymerase ligase N-terminal domain-containing protein [Thermodesulfovibrio sp. 1176]MDI6713502.1 DNA polymerase ligase N-terminal domain-containing protein [Thermodesulfovibrio sp.]
MPYFVVHEHHARNLHFDLRLEKDGVLKSWALPKGPSMNPADKRLAIMVEDHPLDYGDFEGVIPEGHYGAGKVYIWDKGEYNTVKGSIEEGQWEINMEGNILKGNFVLLKLKGRADQWLFIKKKDKFADHNFKLFYRKS